MRRAVVRGSPSQFWISIASASEPREERWRAHDLLVDAIERD
jgi:hypothetical protein